MQTLKNLLSDRDYDFLGSYGSWTVNAPHSGSASREKFKFVNVGSLRVVAGSTATVTLTSPTETIDDEWGWGVRAFVWVYVPRSAAASVTVNVATPAVTSTTDIQALRPNAWNLLDVDGPIAVESSTVSMIVRVGGLQSADVMYISNPVICAPDAISRNIFAAETWMRIPDYLRESDADQVEPTFPMLRFLDVMTADANEIFDIFERYRYITPEDGGALEAPSALQPEEASIEVLRWWAQLLGIKFYDPSSGSTPWVNFETLLDPDGVPEWTDWLTLPDADSSGTVTWDELEEFSPNVTGLLALLQWQVRTAYFGLRGGTKEAIVNAAKAGLSGTKTVTYLIHDGGDPWKIRIQTKQSESPNGEDVGDPDGTILALIANAIPAGYEVVHETVSG